MKTYLQFVTEGVSSDGGLYSYRQPDPASIEFLSSWMLENHIPNPLPPQDLHCTVVYSTCNVPGYTTDPRLVMLKPASYGIQMLGAALVLSFKSTVLEHQWNLANSLGAETTYPRYLPHISLSYKVPVEFDIDVLKPPPVPLMLDAEQSRHLVDGWSDKGQVVSGTSSIGAKV